MRFALVDGLPATDLAIDDRGLHYGDGLFETLAVRGGTAEFLGYHLERLSLGAATLRIDGLDVPAIERELAAAAVRIREGVLKLIVTRGRGERGFRPSPGARPTRIVLGYDMPSLPAEWAEGGVRVRICKTRLGSNRALAGLKHLNRLEQVLARGEWQDPDVAEGLMLDEARHVVCATSANLFLVLDGSLLTPALDGAGVAGVTRRVIIEIASRAGMPVGERRVKMADLHAASELMLSSSVIGLVRVRALEDRRLPEAPLWRQLASALRQCAGKPPA